MPLSEAKAILEGHLRMCDAASRGNTPGANLWRDAAAAIRAVVAKAEAAR